MTATRPTNDDFDAATLWRLWRDATARPEIDHALRRIMDDLDADVRARGPTCWSSGKCCRFDAFGHRLYVTGLEAAWTLMHAGPPPKADDLGVCPYQRDKLCTIHEDRPMGCRVFFCQQSAQAWQPDVYERHLTRLRRLHDEHGIPYRYMEWLAALQESATV
ncbi:MAG: hypothetical protein IT440_01965 [Phycisphaeraceae bacterium]|nr:hypothetical protein [Phycisphaeraceae bacterium]